LFFLTVKQYTEYIFVDRRQKYQTTPHCMVT